MKILSRTIRKARGRHCARIRYQDENGKHELLRTCDSRPEARTKLAQLETELLEKGPAQLVAGKVTFRQLVDYAKTTRYTKATYDKHGAVVSGLRGFTAANSVLNQLVRFFGDKDIRKIDGDLLEKYKLVRISGSKGWRKVELSTVHRQLSTARALFNIAIQTKWLSENPFKGRPDLIQTDAETPSEIATRAMSEAEAQRVLQALDTPERGLIIKALNSGNFEPSKDDFETQLYVTAARVCASHNDPLNYARFLIRADLNTDAPLTHIDELTAALKQCKPRQKVLKQLMIDFPSSAYAKHKNAAIKILITEIEQLNETTSL